MTKFMPKLTLVTVAAVTLYVTAIGQPPPLKSCLWTSGIASAAPSPAPSPTCASDLRDCLHAHVRTGLYGVRYVLPEDTSRCVEAFNACRHGSAGGGGSPAPPPTTGRSNSKGLPQHFGINHGAGGVSDCRATGDSITCTESWKTDTDSYTGEFTGKLSGLTLTGTRTTHRTGHSPGDPGCIIDEIYSGPVTYVFSPDGSATFTAGPNQRRTTFSGSCSGSNSGATEVMKGTATWSPMS